MITKAEFQQQIAASISNYSTAARFYQARDPRLLAQLDAMATMLSMLSAEQDVASMEQFTKARDVTVLADAAIKGVLPFARAARVSVLVENSGLALTTIIAGRVLLDAQGRKYSVDMGASINAGGTAVITASQHNSNDMHHVVSISQPFYSIEIPTPADGKKITSIALATAPSVGSPVDFAYSPEFTNVDVGDKVFNLETDEQRVLFVRFGALNIAGYQPDAGEEFTVTTIETEGYFELPAGSTFTFEYIASPDDLNLKLTLQDMLAPGADPMDVRTMREVTSYPSIYDASAVYLGNFDFLVRRNLSPFRFLSVWNEQKEEAIRGPNIGNINTIFVSTLKDGVVQSELEAQISAVIKSADDGYRVAFVPPSVEEIPVDIHLKLAAIYDKAAVESKIREIIAAEYGPDSKFATRGNTRVQYKRIYDLLTSNVPALQDREADLTVVIDDSVVITPERYRYVSQISLTVVIGYSG